MASDGRSRPRTASNAASLPLRNGHSVKQTRKADEPTRPRSTHTSDEFLTEFLDPAFDPAGFLNAKLPPLASKSASTSTAGGGGAVPVSELSTQAQTLLSQLNAHTNRLSDTLTQLTDDILRSGSRLAYQVEMLRGETLSLSETLNDTLEEEMAMFVGPTAGSQTALSTAEAEEAPSTTKRGDGNAGDGDNANTDDSGDPSYIKKLQTLTLVRERLDSVIKTFGDAMDFVFPPSEISVSSSFLSVSAPEPGSDQQSSEDKGQQVLRQLRDEISGLLSKSDDPIRGIEKAANRIEELKELNKVWKGTAEEKGRSKFIESLAKTVEDRHRELVRETELAAKRQAQQHQQQQAKTTGASKTSTGKDGAVDDKAPLGGFGLISQLQKLRSGL